MDDILIHVETREQCQQPWYKVQQRLRGQKIKVNYEKSRTDSAQETESCGHRYRNGVLEPIAEIEVIRDWTEPRNLFMKTFGIVNYMRDFVPNLAAKAEPLYKATGTWMWTPAQYKSFCEVRRQAV